MIHNSLSNVPPRSYRSSIDNNQEQHNHDSFTKKSFDFMSWCSICLWCYYEFYICTRGKQKIRLIMTGIEPTTFAMPAQCSANCVTRSTRSSFRAVARQQGNILQYAWCGYKHNEKRILTLWLQFVKERQELTHRDTSIKKIDSKHDGKTRQHSKEC